MAALPAMPRPTLAMRRATLPVAFGATVPDTPQMGREHGRIKLKPFTRAKMMFIVACSKLVMGILLPTKEKGPAFQPVPVYNPIVKVRLTRLPPPPGGPK